MGSGWLSPGLILMTQDTVIQYSQIDFTALALKGKHRGYALASRLQARRYQRQCAKPQ